MYKLPELPPRPPHFPLKHPPTIPQFAPIMSHHLNLPPLPPRTCIVSIPNDTGDLAKGFGVRGIKKSHFGGLGDVDESGGYII